MLSVRELKTEKSSVRRTKMVVMDSGVVEEGVCAEIYREFQLGFLQATYKNSFRVEN